jgi:hypothetical protein
MGRAREERDRFGLPMHWSFIEDEQQFSERMAATKAFVSDAVEAVIRQVGRKAARQMFLKALRPTPPGRQPDEKENALLLATYDRQIALRVLPRHAARAAADEMATRPNDDVASIAKHIRTLVKDRTEVARRAEQEAAWLKKLSPLLLFEEGEGGSESEADIK